MIRTLIQALPAYGPVLLFALICVESMGVPIPGETIVVAAAAFAAAGRGSIAAVVAASILGGIVGGMVAYGIGRRGTARLLAARGRRGQGLERTRAFFARHGGKAVVGGRFIAFVRSFLGLTAGAVAMPFREFALWNAVGAAVWGITFSALGYVFGRNLPRLERGLAAAGLALAVLVALIALVVFLVRVVWPRRAEAWAALEGAWEGATTSPPVLALQQQLPRTWRFVAARFSPTTFLVFHLVVGMAISLVALWLFGGLIEDQVGGGALMRFDYALAMWAHDTAPPGGIAAARVLSFLGSPPVLIFVGISVASRLLFRRQRIPAFGWVGALLGGALLAIALEHVVRRPAPPFADPFSTGAAWRIPSAHAFGGLVAYGMLAYLVATLRLDDVWSRVAVVVAAGVFALLIGASRLYLGVEYFSDVMGGFAAGAVWLGACVSGVELTWKTMPAPA